MDNYMGRTSNLERIDKRGSNVAAGDQLFDNGERLSPKDAILLGDLGYDEVVH